MKDLLVDQLEESKKFRFPVNGMRFYPWRGPNYEARYQGSRVLAVGESAI
jgi:hypothetical protein